MNRRRFKAYLRAVTPPVVMPLGTTEDDMHNLADNMRRSGRQNLIIWPGPAHSSDPTTSTDEVLNDARCELDLCLANLAEVCDQADCKDKAIAIASQERDDACREATGARDMLAAANARADQLQAELDSLRVVEKSTAQEMVRARKDLEAETVALRKADAAGPSEALPPLQPLAIEVPKLSPLTAKHADIVIRMTCDGNSAYDIASEINRSAIGRNDWINPSQVRSMVAELQKAGML